MRSVLAQTHADWELVIVDDGSTDDSHDVAAEAIAGEARARIVRQENAGVCVARNRGYAELSGSQEAVIFFDADDVMVPTALERLTAELAAHPGTAMVHCGSRFVDDEGTVLPDMGKLPPRLRAVGPWAARVPDSEPVTTFAQIMNSGGIIPSVTLIARDAFDAVGRWDEVFGSPSEDTDLFMRLALHGPVRRLDETLVDYRVHAGQTTATAEALGEGWRRLNVKWAAPTGLTPEQQAVVDAAWRFRARQAGLRRFVQELPELVRTGQRAATHRHLRTLIAGWIDPGRPRRYYAAMAAPEARKPR